MFEHIHIHIYIYTQKYASVHVQIHILEYTYINVCIYQQIPWLYIFKFIHTYMYICTAVSLKLPGDLAEEIANKPPTITIWFRVRASAKRIYSHIMYIYTGKHWHLGCIWSVGSIKSSVSIAKYCLFYRALLQKRPVTSSVLLTKATPYHNTHTYSVSQ